VIKADTEDYKISREEVFGSCFSFMLLSIYRQTDAILFDFLAHAMQCINAIILNVISSTIVAIIIAIIKIEELSCST